MLVTRLMRRALLRLALPARCERGVAMLEFAFIAPVFVLFSIGILEFAVLGFNYHMAGESTRIGTRTAIIVPAIADVDVLTSAGQEIKCTGTSDTNVSCDSSTVQSVFAFAQIVNAMKITEDRIEHKNVVVIYGHAAIGDASLPNGVKPFVTVRVVNYKHHFVVIGDLLPFVPKSVTLPDFSVTQMGQGRAVTDIL